MNQPTKSLERIDLGKGWSWKAYSTDPQRGSITTDRYHEIFREVTQQNALLLAAAMHPPAPNVVGDVRVDTLSRSEFQQVQRVLAEGLERILADLNGLTAPAPVTIHDESGHGIGSYVPAKARCIGLDGCDCTGECR